MSKSNLPSAVYGSDETPIIIGDFKIPCYVLDNGQRVLSGTGMIKALGMARGIENPLRFINKGNENLGYEATTLQQVVRGVAKAYLQGKLQKQQEHIGRNAEILDDAFSKVGLIALIDEATGYQNAVQRAKDELQQLLSKLLLQEHAKWIKTFPDEFFEMIFKMKVDGHGWV
jgi:hypothetical protein